MLNKSYKTDEGTALIIRDYAPWKQTIVYGTLLGLAFLSAYFGKLEEGAGWLVAACIAWLFFDAAKFTYNLGLSFTAALKMIDELGGPKAATKGDAIKAINALRNKKDN